MKQPQWQQELKKLIKDSDIYDKVKKYFINFVEARDKKWKSKIAMVEAKQKQSKLL